MQDFKESMSFNIFTLLLFFTKSTKPVSKINFLPRVESHKSRHDCKILSGGKSPETAGC